ncbi:hypothetical protein J2R76_002546 [Bradyrhizobium sp. USDA 4532]|uniref:hypothetical protein n=1 Tax=unclassified Bradyrhizobium TaxID=2631580 RepID=UPI00209CF8DC|nr:MULTISPECIES: hypothetical protein [unclassified Bradyrhizobium]MCP1834209.1 hypothetical protein [Bradyrhizobium sp. USDA 4545]MCP1918955.1 hypothetical protein [Bradyrhizobium sp. USDA 4532]
MINWSEVESRSQGTLNSASTSPSWSADFSIETSLTPANDPLASSPSVATDAPMEAEHDPSDMRSLSPRRYFAVTYQSHH